MATCSQCGANLKEESKCCGDCGAPANRPSPDKTSASEQTPVNPNVAALLSYVFWFFSGVLFLLLEPYKSNPFVRFHAYQSIGLSVTAVVLAVGFSILEGFLAILTGGLGTFTLSPFSTLIMLGVFVLWIICMLKACQYKKYYLPVVGEIAAKMAA